jgi:hypothetical protein
MVVKLAFFLERLFAHSACKFFNNNLFVIARSNCFFLLSFVMFCQFLSVLSQFLLLFKSALLLF